MKPAMIAFFCVAAPICAWLALPRVPTTHAFAAEVEAAIGRANTWHFVGWKVEGGKKSRWEVWGRRQPFFYREQIGDDILIDDGQTRLRLLPPDAFQKRGYAISLPSEKLPLRAVVDSKEGPEQRFVEGIGGDYLSHMDERSRANGQVVYQTNDVSFAKSEARLIVSMQSHLPVRYTLTRSEHPWLPKKHRWSDSFGSPFLAAELAMNYNVPLPKSSMVAPVPSKYQRIDGHKGLELRPQLLGRNKDGSLHVKFDYSLGGKPIKSEHFPWFHAATLLQCPPFTQTRDARYPTDNLGNSYQPRSVNHRLLHTEHGESTDFWLEPMHRTPGVPQSLRIPVVAKLSFDKGIPHPNVTVVWTDLPILSEEETLVVPLQNATPQTPSGTK